MARIAFIDIEASGLDERESYPIEIAWALSTGGRATARLIRPEPDWTHWEPDAELMHGVSREDLFSEGLPARDVVAEMREAVGNAPLHADHREDDMWFKRLLAAAETDWSPRLHAAPPVIEREAHKNRKDLSELRRQVRLKHPTIHRAGPDAEFLRDLYRAACRK